MVNVTEVTLIQELRAIHALSELNIKINIKESEVQKFSMLNNYFEMIYSIGSDDGFDISKVLEIDHSIPSTSVFSIDKPLIFPKIITEHLKNSWPKRRRFKYSFAGLITPERERTIEEWLYKNYDKNYRLKEARLWFKIKRKFYAKFNIKKPLLKKFGDLFLYSSNRGRTFPEKSWDEEYYNFLLRSKFVLCPSGVYIWTYRFFESILCGAIPIVEKSSPCYNGFKYYNMDEDLENLKWTKEVAEYNFKLCVKRITFSEKENLDIYNRFFN